MATMPEPTMQLRLVFDSAGRAVIRAEYGDVIAETPLEFLVEEAKMNVSYQVERAAKRWDG